MAVSPKNDIQTPIQSVLDALVGAYRVENALAVRRQRTYRVALLGGDLGAYRAVDWRNNTMGAASQRQQC